MNGVCDYCGKKILQRRNNDPMTQKYCSTSCNRDALENRSKKKQVTSIKFNKIKFASGHFGVITQTWLDEGEAEKLLAYLNAQEIKK